jgi:hypothetical protein
MGRRGRELRIVLASPDLAAAPMPLAESESIDLTGSAAELARLRRALAGPDPKTPLLALLHQDGSLDCTIEGPIEDE